ncbi:RNA polymerase sigma factor SigJ [Streptomyces abyssomicinicus]|uniref:RNA polymerase sigma factor SigJ n=1 Tax=Streptomyces abyssomicinicus TaxID=574929 RepID=UPI001250B56A|nr:RNA polymerase sigma factor SigJ [Streptomyces abyssomicinicus]
MTTDSAAEAAAREFEEHRGLLTGVAYRMLGRVSDAEDVVQDAWLRWEGADRSVVREPRAYLVRVVTRLAVDRLRQIKARNESYVGPWLPEPYVTDFGAFAPEPADTARRAELADSVSFAVLVLLETLSPLERAVFVLREAFGHPHAEIAAMLGREEPAVRRMAVRARRHVEEGRPRYQAGPRERRDLTERFLAAAAGGDLERLLEVLAPDVRLVADTGGRAKAPLRELFSAAKVARFLHGIRNRATTGWTYRPVEVNGGPAYLVLEDGVPQTLVQAEVADGLVRTVFLVRNPDKLRALAAPRD